MNRFDYHRPATLAEALALGATPGAAYLAAGTNLLDLMKLGVARPGVLVDVTRLPGLDRIERLPDGATRIGAMVRNSDLARDAGILRDYPALAEAILAGASAQLRNAATVGGNLMQKTRCRYFQDKASACNRRSPGAGCDAVGGVDEGMAILGWSDACIATHPSDFCVPLAALDAVVEIAGPAGAREVPLTGFHHLPGLTPAQDTALAPGELVTAIRLPPAAAGFRQHARYMKLRERTSYAFALVSVAAMLRWEDGAILEARLALGGVAARPWRATEAEALLAGAALGRDAFEAAARAALADARPANGGEAKIELARRLIVRTLMLAAAGTPARIPALPASPFAATEESLTHA